MPGFRVARRRPFRIHRCTVFGVTLQSFATSSTVRSGSGPDCGGRLASSAVSSCLSSSLTTRRAASTAISRMALFTPMTPVSGPREPLGAARSAYVTTLTCDDHPGVSGSQVGFHGHWHRAETPRNGCRVGAAPPFARQGGAVPTRCIPRLSALGVADHRVPTTGVVKSTNGVWQVRLVELEGEVEAIPNAGPVQQEPLCFDVTESVTRQPYREPLLHRLEDSLTPERRMQAPELFPKPEQLPGA